MSDKTVVGNYDEGNVGNLRLVLSPKGEERASNPPRGEQEEIPGKNLQEYPKTGVTIFGSKGGNALIRIQKFNVPRGDGYLKFK